MKTKRLSFVRIKTKQLVEQQKLLIYMKEEKKTYKLKKRQF